MPAARALARSRVSSRMVCPGGPLRVSPGRVSALVLPGAGQKGGGRAGERRTRTGPGAGRLQRAMVGARRAARRGPASMAAAWRAGPLTCH